MKNTATGTIHLTITSAHVAKMREAYDSEMCDRSRANAAWFALEPHIANPKSFRVLRKNGRLILRHESDSISAPQDMGSWLDSAERGFAVKEQAAFDLQIPYRWLKSSPQQSSPTHPSEDVQLAA